MNIQCLKLEQGAIMDLVKLLKVYEDVFEMNNFLLPDSDYLHALLKNKQIIFFAAHEGIEIVGGLTAYILPSAYARNSEVYIYDLAVAKAYQRKGIGSKLVNSLKGYCSSMSVRQIFVQADTEDQHAIDFYQSIGGLPKNAIHFSYDVDPNPGNKR